VKITEYVTDGGKTVPRYSYLWSNENYVIRVFEILLKKLL
jgi:hypothetical protein